MRLPVLMLVGSSAAQERVLALEMGADDCIARPFDLRELVARIHALLRRWRDPLWGPLSEFRFGDIHVDFRQGTATRNGVPLALTTKELKLLRYLVARRGTIVSRQELLSEVWDYRAAISRTLDVLIADLRQKVEPVPHQPRFIRTVRGKGYLFQK